MRVQWNVTMRNGCMGVYKRRQIQEEANTREGYQVRVRVNHLGHGEISSATKEKVFSLHLRVLVLLFFLLVGEPQCVSG